MLVRVELVLQPGWHLACGSDDSLGKRCGSLLHGCDWTVVAVDGNLLQVCMPVVYWPMESQLKAHCLQNIIRMRVCFDESYWSSK